MSKPFTIYTAGPIDFLSLESQTGWRDNVLDHFSMSNTRVLNPTRRPHFCDLNDQEVFNLDIIDIHNSDLLLADCRKHDGIKQFGTPAEIMYFSYVLKRPVIGWYDGNEGYNDKSVFQNVLVDRFFPSLEEALDHITTFYTGTL